MCYLLFAAVLAFHTLIGRCFAKLYESNCRALKLLRFKGVQDIILSIFQANTLYVVDSWMIFLQFF